MVMIMTEQMTQDTSQEKIPVGISSCLLGEKVRFDGGHKLNTYVVRSLGEYFDYVPFCPEVAIGMGTPREPIRLVGEAGELRCVGTRTASVDVTAELAECADEQRDWQVDLRGYILKKDSPSCGMERVKVYNVNGGQPTRDGVGIYARGLLRNFPNLPVEEEGRLGDPVLRENFIHRVLIYHRWRALLSEGVSWVRLGSFHATHKLVLFSHDQNMARALGRELADAGGGDVQTFARHYETQLMALLKVRATRGNHVNVLQHIQGYLKNQLDAGDKAELSASIHDYRLGHLPLIVPIILLRHHFRKYPDPYIENACYLYPHPRELMLLNSL
jgi:uncharacterized protein YbgA (DUF1722 family)/uncharacterized protein YbbK (DUF523 family)